MVHPHGCGELINNRDPSDYLVGSSPRVWGTPECPPDNVRGIRFIPTGVGNSPPSVISAGRTSVHPHGCGELSSGLPITGRVSGSSPRVWGTRVNIEEKTLVCWFIPTGVGNSRLEQMDFTPHVVHPHGCGELHISCYEVERVGGSSPRVWGTRFPAISGQ